MCRCGARSAVTAQNPERTLVARDDVTVGGLDHDALVHGFDDRAVERLACTARRRQIFASPRGRGWWPRRRERRRPRPWGGLARATSAGCSTRLDRATGRVGATPLCRGTVLDMGLYALSSPEGRCLSDSSASRRAGRDSRHVRSQLRLKRRPATGETASSSAARRLEHRLEHRVGRRVVLGRGGLHRGDPLGRHRRLVLVLGQPRARLGGGGSRRAGPSCRRRSSGRSP